MKARIEISLRDAVKANEVIAELVKDFDLNVIQEYSNTWIVESGSDDYYEVVDNLARLGYEYEVNDF